MQKCPKLKDFLDFVYNSYKTNREHRLFDDQSELIETIDRHLPGDSAMGK
jgi:hypothetical protein